MTVRLSGRRGAERRGHPTATSLGARSNRGSGVGGSDTVSFQLNEPLRVDEAFDFDERACWLHTGKYLTVRARSLLPPRDIGKHDAGTNDILEGEAGVSNCLGNDLETALGLAVHIARRCDSAARRDGSSAGDGQKRIGPHGAREADAGLKR